MQFQVPQFIDIEDKLIGPMTLKQFLYIAGAGGFSFVLFFALQTWLWVVVTILLLAIASSFAFVKFNGRPMPTVFISAIKYIWSPRFYLWQREQESKKLPKTQKLPSRAKASARNPLKALWFKMRTRTKAIPKREKTIPHPRPEIEPVKIVQENSEPALPKSFLHPEQG